MLQDLRSRLYEVSGEARRRDIENQTIIDDLVSHINQQSLQAITDQPRLQAIEDQQRLQAIEDQQRLQAIEDQPASSSTDQQSTQPSDDKSHLFGRSLTGLLTIKSKTKAGWGNANKGEMQSLLRDFYIPFDSTETKQKLFNKVVQLFERNNG